LEVSLTKADSEQLARSIAEEQYSDLEKEKIMKELELKEMMARHRQELGEKDVTIGSVSGPQRPPVSPPCSASCLHTHSGSNFYRAFCRRFYQSTFVRRK
jgi:hypothetical protein